MLYSIPLNKQGTFKFTILPYSDVPVGIAGPKLYMFLTWVDNVNHFSKMIVTI